MEKKNKVTQGIARNSWLGLVLLGAINLSCGDNDPAKQADDKKPLKITLTPPPEIVRYLQSGDNTLISNTNVLTVKVTEGKDKAADYKLEIGAIEGFKEKDYTQPETDADKKLQLLFPIADAKLDGLFGLHSLSSGDEKKICVVFKAGTKVSNGSSRIKVKVVDKSGNPVSNEVEIKWKSGM